MPLVRVPNKGRWRCVPGPPPYDSAVCRYFPASTPPIYVPDPPTPCCPQVIVNESCCEQQWRQVVFYEPPIPPPG